MRRPPPPPPTTQLAFERGGGRGEQTADASFELRRRRFPFAVFPFFPHSPPPPSFFCRGGPFSSPPQGRCIIRQQQQQHEQQQRSSRAAAPAIIAIGGARCKGPLTVPLPPPPRAPPDAQCAPPLFPSTAILFRGVPLPIPPSTSHHFLVGGKRTHHIHQWALHNASSSSSPRRRARPAPAAAAA